jgi:hypothetical protein
LASRVVMRQERSMDTKTRLLKSIVVTCTCSWPAAPHGVPTKSVVSRGTWVPKDHPPSKANRTDPYLGLGGQGWEQGQGQQRARHGQVPPHPSMVAGLAQTVISLNNALPSSQAATTTVGSIQILLSSGPCTNAPITAGRPYEVAVPLVGRQ